MNEAHLHLIVNHLPIVVPIVGIFVMILGFVFRSEVVKRTAYSIFVLGSACAILAFLTGEGAEEAIENMQGISEQMIHHHEEAAQKHALMCHALALFSLFGLWASWKQMRVAKIASILSLVLGGILLFFAQQTGTTGGEIRHTEIRSDSTIPILDTHQDKED